MLLSRAALLALVVVALSFIAPSFASAAVDWSGDGKTDVLAVDGSGNLVMYRGNGVGGWMTGNGEVVGSGWNAFPSIVQPADFTSDGKSDLLAVMNGGNLYLYRGNGFGGWATGVGELTGTQWNMYQRILARATGTATGSPMSSR